MDADNRHDPPDGQEQLAELVAELLPLVKNLNLLANVAVAFSQNDLAIQFLGRILKLADAVIVPDGFKTDKVGLAVMLNESERTARRDIAESGRSRNKKLIHTNNLGLEDE